MSSESEISETENTEIESDDEDDDSGFDPNESEDESESEIDSDDEDDSEEDDNSDDDSGFDPNVSEEESETEAELTESEAEIPDDLNDITSVIPNEILVNNPFLTQPETTSTNQTNVTTQPGGPVVGTQINVPPPTTVSIGGQSGQTLSQLSDQLQHQEPAKGKRVLLPTIDRDLANLEKAAKLPGINVALEGLSITGDINVDLKPHTNETFIEFDTRSKITRALILSPYNLSIKAALIAGKIWCQKALYGIVYSDDIENSLREIQLRGS